MFECFLLDRVVQKRDKAFLAEQAAVAKLDVEELNPACRIIFNEFFDQSCLGDYDVPLNQFVDLFTRDAGGVERADDRAETSARQSPSSR